MTFSDLPQLKHLQTKLWNWPQSRAALMVGAGFSMNAEPLPGTRNRFGTWRQMIREMFNDLHPMKPGMTAREIEERNERFAGTSFLRLASEYEAALTTPALETLIRKMNPDSEHVPGNLHQQLLRLPWADVFTTNYDTLLERTEVVGRNYQVVSKADDLMATHSPRIIKLHGSFPSHTPFICTEEHYRTYPRIFAPFVNTVQQSLLENAFVLLGFSGDDPNFLAWSGWIRDHLQNSHAPIYLVGCLELTPSQNELLRRRDVTPIDLTPLVPANCSPRTHHAEAIARFLNLLELGQPMQPYEWPKRHERVPLPSDILEQSCANESDAPPPIPDLPPHPQPDPANPYRLVDPVTDDVAIGVLKRWKYEREKYPGWIVARIKLRQSLRLATEAWSERLIKVSKSWNAAERLITYSEINWRLEIAMVPLLKETIDPFKAAVDEFRQSFVAGIRNVLRPEFSFGDDPATKFVEIAFALLRQARETYALDRWSELRADIAQWISGRPEFADRLAYETALKELWNVDRFAAKAQLSAWQPSDRSVRANLWKAGMLAEVDRPEEAARLLRTTLREIRRSQKIQGHTVELLSMEGWCTYLIFVTECSADIRLHGSVRAEFDRRWEELRPANCNPWEIQNDFNLLLSTPPSLNHLTQIGIEGSLPGFAFIRMFEVVGIPLRLPNIDMVTEKLSHACQLIEPLVSFWSVALLIRRGDRERTLKEGPLLRDRIATLDRTSALRLYGWLHAILKGELSVIDKHASMDRTQSSLLDLLSKALARIVFRLSGGELVELFESAKKLYGFVRQDEDLQHSSHQLLRAVFEAADVSLLVHWLDDLLCLDLPEPGTLKNEGAEYISDPIDSIPTDQTRWRDFIPPTDIREQIGKRANWLIAKAKSEHGLSRAIVGRRLGKLYDLNYLTPAQQTAFGRLLWHKVKKDKLPAFGYFEFAYTQFPVPSSVDREKRIKTAVLNIESKTLSSRNPEGKLSFTNSWERHPLMAAALRATRPSANIIGEMSGTISWSPAEAEKLYMKCVAWWNEDKQLFDWIGKYDIFELKLKMERHGGLMGEFLARAVIPFVKWNESQWDELRLLLEDIRKHGCFPTVAYPHLLRGKHFGSEQAALYVREGISSSNTSASVQGMTAFRHWIWLSGTVKGIEPPRDCLDVLVSQVCSRVAPFIRDNINHLAFLIAESPSFFDANSATRLCASLKGWDFCTDNGSESVEFLDDFKPTLRARIALLAGVLETWHVRRKIKVPTEVVAWQKLSAYSEFPEVKRSYRLGTLLPLEKNHNRVVNTSTKRRKS